MWVFQGIWEKKKKKKKSETKHFYLVREQI